MLPHCLSSDRKPPEEICQQAGYFSDIPLLKQVMDALTDIVLILNEDRQIVWANAPLFERFHLDETSVYGFRPGETLDCIHASESHGGCGTTEFCKTCGAAKALYACQQFRSDTRECRITRSKKNIGSLDLRVKAIPITFHDEPFAIFIITDVSHEKRRRALERIFFHDVLNIAGNIRGLTDLVQNGFPEKRGQYTDMLLKSADMLVREIHAQRELAAAENGELSVHPGPVDSLDLIEKLADLYRNHKVTGNRHIRVDDKALRVTFTSDRTLLLRVLGNMLKNALESCGPGETVTIGCDRSEREVQFWVHNPGGMPYDVQLQIFQRSFSTKAKDRGLGTYSMKLLSERYLKGHVSFISSPETGTIFTACYPLSPDSAQTECD